VVKALTESAEVAQLDVIALHDARRGTPDARYLGTGQFSYHGCAGNAFLFVRETALHLLRTKYDLVLSGHVHLTPLLFLLFPLNPRRNQVTFAYGIDAWNRLPPQRRLPLLASRAIVAISHFTAERLARANCIPPAKVRVLHNCLDPILDGNQPSHPPPASPEPIILTVSRLSRLESSKGHTAILRALPEIARAIPGVLYEVVGDGDLRPDLERLADELGVTDHVHFAGHVTDDALAGYYARCSVFAMPSKWEGFGFVFLEAMAHGKPVVAGAVDAGPEVIGTDGKAGVLVEPDDINALSAVLVQLLEDRRLREQLGRSGRQRVRSLFGYERFRAELLSLVVRPQPMF